MVRGVSNARVQTQTVQPSQDATTVPKETKTSVPTSSQTQPQAQQKPANKAGMKSEHKLGGQLKSAQLQQQLQNTSGGARSGLTGEFRKPELPAKDGKSGLTGEFRKPQLSGKQKAASTKGKSGLTGEFEKSEILNYLKTNQGSQKTAQKVQLPGVYEIATGQKPAQKSHNVQLPGVYQIATGGETQPKTNIVQLPGVYEIAGGSTQEPQKSAPKHTVMDFSKSKPFSFPNKQGIDLKMPEIRIEGYREMRLGSEGPDVKKLQTGLNHWLKAHGKNYQIPTNGKFTKETMGALQEFYKSRGIKASFANKYTLAHLKLEANPNFVKLPPKAKTWLRDTLVASLRPGATTNTKDGVKYATNLIKSPGFWKLSAHNQSAAVLKACLGGDHTFRLVNNSAFQSLSPQTRTMLMQQLDGGTVGDLLDLAENAKFRNANPTVQQQMLKDRLGADYFDPNK